MISDYLFVYGTLLKDFESYMSKYLVQNAEFIGTGYFYGKLFEISWYPGAVLSRHSNDKVHGHIFKILNKETTFKVLDAYEGISDSSEHTNEYKRLLIDAFLCETTKVKTWVYICNLPTTHLKPIPFGKYA